MKTVLAISVLATLLLIGAAFAVDTAPIPVTLQGQISCVSCGAVLPGINNMQTESGMCTAAFTAADGRVYAIVPNAVGQELSAVTMHGKLVEVQAYLLPNSQLIEPLSYSFIARLAPTSPYQGLSPFEGRPGVPPVLNF
jgi:hypothetical protein